VAGVAPILRSLEALPRAKGAAGGRWRARCPAHDDDGPSLGWRLGDDGRVLLICRAGCRTEDVVAALGSELSDLFAPEDEAPEEPRLASRSEITDYPIRDAAGALGAIHRRIDRRAGSKSFLWLDPDGRPGLDGLPSVSLPLYGAELVAGYDRARPILVTEGEKVADAVRATGSQAVATVCGAPLVPDHDILAVLDGYDVILAPDHDDAGLAHMSGVAARLAGIATSLRWLDPVGWPAKGDLADILAPGWSAHELHAHVGSGGRLAVDPAVWADVKARLGPLPDGGHGGTDGGRTGAEASDGGHGGRAERDGGTSGPAHTPPPSADPDDEDWVAAYGNGIELPDELRPEAFHGPIGAFAAGVGGVNTLASPVSLLITGLAATGALCGRGAWRVWNESATYPGQFVLLIGGTGEGKGLALRITRRWLERVEGFDAAMIVSDFSSGEGLIQRLVRLAPDERVGDTRALAWSEEFAAVLRAKGRDGSTLGQVLRRAYDGDLLERNTVKPSGRVEQPALSMLAHVTPEELRSEASALDAASGFLNRFLVLPLRSVDVSHPAIAPDETYAALAHDVSEAVSIARSHRAPMLTSPEAQALLERLDEWRQGARRRPGLIGKMLERVSQNVGRLAVAYALSRLVPGTLTPSVEAADVLAALAIGDLSERTVLSLWGSVAPDAESARLLQRVRVAGPEGISPRDLLKALYSNTNRWRGRELVAAALDTGLLRKVPSGRGWRILAGAVVGEASLWQTVVRDAGRSPIVLERSPMSPIEGSLEGSRPPVDQADVGLEGAHIAGGSSAADASLPHDPAEYPHARDRDEESNLVDAARSVFAGMLADENTVLGNDGSEVEGEGWPDVA
jgi:hypothetical protein